MTRPRILDLSCEGPFVDASRLCARGCGRLSIFPIGWEFLCLSCALKERRRDA